MKREETLNKIIAIAESEGLFINEKELNPKALEILTAHVQYVLGEMRKDICKTSCVQCDVVQNQEECPVADAFHKALEKAKKKEKT